MSQLPQLPIFQCIGVQNVDPGKELFLFINDDGSVERVTWRSLFENVNRLTRSLQKSGIGQGDALVILMRNHPEFLYALFAALSLGALAVPVDPRSKGAKLAFQIRNTRARGIFCADNCLEFLDKIQEEIKDVPILGVAYKEHHKVEKRAGLPDFAEILDRESPDLPDNLPALDFSRPAQVIHTSGTTGDPKGVVLKTDRYMVYGFMATVIWNYQPDDVLYTGLSMTHGNAQSVTVIPAMAKNIRAVISERFTKSRIWDICREHGCTSFSLLGGMMAGIFNEPPRPDDAQNPVRTVISAGTPRAIWEDFMKRFNVRIHEWYGAVEGGLAHNPPGAGPVGSFGKPPSDLIEMKIVDENDNELGPGELGELVSRMKSGPTQVQYFGKEKESSEKTRGGWLRSGDICHKDEQGWYYFDFRKGGGLRRAGDFIQPDYVERVIGSHPTVSEVVVYGVPAASGAPGESDLVAAIAPFPGEKVDVEGVKKLCMEKLERNSVPSFFQLKDSIPKTVSEKPLARLLKHEFSPDAKNVVRV